MSFIIINLHTVQNELMISDEKVKVQGEIAIINFNCHLFLPPVKRYINRIKIYILDVHVCT